MENPVLIFGVNAVGKSAREIFEGNGHVVYGYLDDDKKLHGTEVDAIVVLGDTDNDGFLKLIGKKCEAFVAIDDIRLRKTIVTMLNEKRKVQPVNAIHRQALVSTYAQVAHGIFVDRGAIVGTHASIGNHCIIHAGAIISPDASLADFVQIGAGSIINSGAVIEAEVFIGSGVTIVSGVTIGKGARIGAGSVVIGPVKPGETVFGNPAQPIKS